MQNDRWGAEIQVFSTASGDSDVDFYQKQSLIFIRNKRNAGVRKAVRTQFHLASILRLDPILNVVLRVIMFGIFNMLLNVLIECIFYFMI